MSIAIICLSLALCAEPESYPRPDLIIEPSTLNDRLAKVVILDVRSNQAYDAGHIPARFVWTWRLSAKHSTRRSMPKLRAKNWATWGSMSIRRWSFRLTIGERRLDCGGSCVTGESSTQSCSTAGLGHGRRRIWRSARSRSCRRESRARSTPTNRLATREQVLEAIKDKSNQVLDARSSGEYCGDAGNAKAQGSDPGGSEPRMESVHRRQNRQTQTSRGNLQSCSRSPASTPPSRS